MPKKEHPILFKGHMVRAILADIKTQTSRTITRNNSYFDGGSWPGGVMDDVFDWDGAWVDDRCLFSDAPCLKLPWPAEGTVHRVTPKWVKRDRLWIRETWAADVPGCEAQGGYTYRADHDDPKGDGPDRITWRPSIFMPRAASRQDLEITRHPRPMRPREITEDEAKAEGATWTDNGPVSWSAERGLTFEQADPINGWKAGWSHEGETKPERCHKTATASFWHLWNSINAKPKPAFLRGGNPTCYVSYPFSAESRDPRTVINGLPHHCYPNRPAWAFTFKRVSKK